jgi:manganese oxidase
MWISLVVLAAVVTATPALAQAPAAPLSRGAPPPEAIVENRNLTAAGIRAAGEVSVRLEARKGIWHPQADDGPALEVYAFGEEGRPASIPGPMIRVPEGARVRVTLRNRLDTTLVVVGLSARPIPTLDTVRVAPGTSREVSFTAAAPGTYYYWGTTTESGVEDRDGVDSQLSGALVVDPPGGGRPDRVFVLGLWAQEGNATRPEREAMVINGRAWPYTERVALTQGDSVHWRWINATASAHPMHLHGFYFAVGSRGTWRRDTVYAAGRHPRAVTELMPPAGTAAIDWLPDRPGNWVFHCHFAFHVMNGLAPPDTSEHGRHILHDMSGLVLGMHIAPRGPQLQPAANVIPRRIRLLVQQRARPSRPPAMGFVIQDGTEPSPDSVVSPGPLLVLQQGQPVSISVVNRLAEPTGMHWHGLEIPSFPDGVPNWSGSPGHVMPPIAAGDSFIASFTPPRAGTFMYHAHANEMRQINSGLYGALIVLPPGASLDPERERIVLVGSAGAPEGEDRTSGLVNGQREPRPMNLVTGRSYRFRLLNIHPDWRVRFALRTDSTVEQWSLVAKDGADTEPWEREPRLANLVTGPGETADFEWAPTHPGVYRLEVTTVRAGWHIPLILRVRDATAAR